MCGLRNMWSFLILMLYEVLARHPGPTLTLFGITIIGSIARHLYSSHIYYAAI